jgi:hypothetical protein
MNWKGCRRKPSWPVLSSYLSIRFSTDQSTTNFNPKEVGSTGRHSISGPPEYEALVLTSTPKCIGHPFRGVQRPVSDADHSSPSSVEINVNTRTPTHNFNS